MSGGVETPFGSDEVTRVLVSMALSCAGYSAAGQCPQSASSPRQDSVGRRSRLDRDSSTDEKQGNAPMGKVGTVVLQRRDAPFTRTAQEALMSTNLTITSPNSSTSVGLCCLVEAVAEFEAAARTLCSMSAKANEHMPDTVYAAQWSVELPDEAMNDGVSVAAVLANVVIAALAEDDTRNARHVSHAIHPRT